MAEMNNPGKTVQPEIPVGGFYNAGDSPKPLLVKRRETADSSAINLLQPKLATNPNLGSSPIDCLDVSDSKAITCTEHADPSVVQNRELVLHVAKPDAAHVIGKFNHNTCFWKLVMASVRRPLAIGKAIQTVASERDPCSSVLVLSKRLQEPCLFRNSPGKVDADQFSAGDGPKTAGRAEPQRSVSCTISEENRPAEALNNYSLSMVYVVDIAVERANPYCAIVTDG